ncbi:hypothetical protein BDV29DRAFT_172027 [Aspergillus leporis]|uniref:Uncharacterized protein n=1 Tax=Aspergillus leporis TaxID=41062 RepID=A0A5N5X849_9EURO|nr:hypothetical protein BDV29DRAFT_172027 [Aspergillus leporis]
MSQCPLISTRECLRDPPELPLGELSLVDAPFFFFFIFSLCFCGALPFGTLRRM